MEIPDKSFNASTAKAVGLRNESLAELMENIVYRVPGCAELMIRKQLQEVAREFCRYTSTLRIPLRFDVEKDVSIYKVPVPFGLVQELLDVEVLGYRDKFHIYNPNILDIRIECNPIVVKIADDWVKEHSYNAVPEDKRNCVMNVSILPGINTDDYPEWFIGKYGEFIVSGTLAKLMSMSNKAWSDPNQAALEFTKYQNGMNEAKFYALKAPHEEHLSMRNKIPCVPPSGGVF